MGRNRGLGLFRGSFERRVKNIVNDGETFVPSSSSSVFSHFLKKHFFLLYKNGNDVDDDDEGVLAWCGVCCERRRWGQMN